MKKVTIIDNKYVSECWTLNLYVLNNVNDTVST
jgi:hypothetical protein